MSNINTSGVPDEVIKAIKEQAASEHPNNYSTQEYVIKDQLKNYKELMNLKVSDVPEEVFLSIKKKAASDHPRNYSTQLYVIKDELKSYRKIKDL